MSSKRSPRTRCHAGATWLGLVIVLALAELGCLKLNSDPLEDAAPSPDGPRVDPDRKDAPVPVTSGTGGSASPSESVPDGSSGPPATTPGCEPGYHSCGGTCKDSNSIEHCGNACSPCPTIKGGTPICSGQRCDVRCPPGQKPCKDECVAEAAACDGICKEGLNLCNMICVAATDPAACGTACTVCPTSAFGKAACDNGKCTLTCNTGYHACEGNCVPDDDVKSCGKSCMPCMPPANADAVCNGTTCGFRCRAGFHECDGQCRPDDSVDSCGDRCDRCPSPPGQPVCRNGKCDFDCPGQTKCGNQCANTRTDPGNCGSCGAVCANPRVCMNGSCQCPGGREFCNNSCVDTSSDSNNCGGCGRRCTGSGKTCQGGQCRCAGGRTDCGDCANTDNDARHCGGCGKPCASPRMCNNGNCQCPSGREFCDGRCVDTNNDTANCGACGRACITGTCCGGNCVTLGRNCTHPNDTENDCQKGVVECRNGMGTCVLKSDPDQNGTICGAQCDNLANSGSNSRCNNGRCAAGPKLQCTAPQRCTYDGNFGEVRCQ